MERNPGGTKNKKNSKETMKKYSDPNNKYYSQEKAITILKIYTRVTWKEIYFLTMTRKELILDKNIKIIYNKLENIKLNQGYIDLSNSSIQNKNDLVDVCNIFRDPRYETFRIFYMRDNKIVGQEAMTSKIPDGCLYLMKRLEIQLEVMKK